MDTPKTSDIIDHLIAILDEGFGSTEKPWSYFTDPSPEAGYPGALKKLQASEANRAIGGNSIAAQINHVTFGMKASSAFIEGDPTPPGAEKWKASWEVAELDEEGWRHLQKKLHESYIDLRSTIQSSALKNSNAIGVSMGAVAHIAYHLGAVRQKINLLKNNQ